MTSMEDFRRPLLEKVVEEARKIAGHGSSLRQALDELDQKTAEKATSDAAVKEAERLADTEYDRRDLENTIAWFEENTPTFDLSFLRSLLDQVNGGRPLTPSQVASHEKIKVTFHVDE